MSLLQKLLTVEWIKLRRRSAFQIVIVVHIAIITFGLAVQQYMHHRNPKVEAFRLPEGWPFLFDTGGSIGMLMILIGIALLTASEATWRTQRQNVIDGLSRAQYFTAKILVAVLLALIMWASLPVIGIIAALLGGSGGLSMPLMDGPSALAFGNLLLYFIALGVTGFMFGMIASSSGAALGFILAFIIIQPIIGAQLAAQTGFVKEIPRYLPLEVFGNLTDRMYYDPEMMARMSEMIVKAGRPLPIGLSVSVLMTCAYIAVFIGITWLVFRNRDL